MSPVRLTSISGIDVREVGAAGAQFDLIIGALSFESRCANIPEVLKPCGGLKIAFMDEGASDTKRREKMFRLLGFRTVSYSDSYMRLVLGELLTGQNMEAVVARGGLRVFIDVSSLPRRIIASVFAVLTAYVKKVPIDLTIGYSLARYVRPSEMPPAPNRQVAPVHPLFAGWTHNPGLPVKAIVGLGYERGKAIGAVEYLQAADWFLYVPSSPEHQYQQKVEEHNRQLIKATKPDKVINYEVTRPVETLLMLGSAISGLKSHAKPVLLPFGPKILFAVTLLAAIVHSEASVWYVSGEESEKPVDRGASPYLTGLTCRMII